jgi:outer membrane protein assembly factor BamB
MKKSIISFLFIYLIISQLQLYGQLNPERQWPQYRGYLAAGVYDNANLPSTFDLKKMVNVKWKVAIPGMGISSPVVWGDKIFLTTAVSEGDKEGFKPGLYGDVNPVNDSSVHEWKVFCIDRNSGKTLWERTSYKGVPAIKRHPKSTHANTSIATDGKFIIAFFGSEGLYCYDFDGKLIWKKSFGVLKSIWTVMKNAEWEFASSPIIADGKVIVQCDVLENSFIAALDVSTGKELWRTERDEYPGWCTPNIYTSEGRKLIAVNGYKLRGGYDLETGKEIWRMSGGGDIQIPTPIIGKDLIYFNSAHGRYSPMMAVSTNAKGDITLKEGEASNEYVKWYTPRGGSYIQTMLLYHDKLYNMNWNGVVNCLDPLTGKEIYNAKLGKSDSFMGSPVAADGKIYIVSEQGSVFIMDDGDKFNMAGEVPLDDICMTSPAIVENMMFIRTQNYLIAIGKN